jgi:DNA-directed RNA polymerase subunit RPC12/RpoP
MEKEIRLYWPYVCESCGHRGLVREKDWRCQNQSCRQPVTPTKYELVENQLRGTQWET